MKQISSRALMTLLVASVVVSVVGTVINFNKLSQLIPLGSGQGLTGFATTATGTVNVSIASVASIVLSDNIINFGSCAPNSSIGSNLSTNNSGLSWGAPGVCTLNGTAPQTTDFFVIQNDGNKEVNISIQINDTAANFIGGTSPQIYYTARNMTGRPGCTNRTGVGGGDGLVNYNCTFTDAASCTYGFEWDFREITGAAATQFPVCSALNYSDTADSVRVALKLSLPPDATPRGERALSFTFTAATFP